MVQPGTDDRLPWLDAPRAAARPRVAPATRRARTPLLVVLGLFAASLIAVMAFLVGRSTAPRPVASTRNATPVVTPALSPRAAPVQAPRVALAPPPVAPLPAASPSPGAQTPTIAAPRASASSPRKARAPRRPARANRATAARRAAVRAAARRSARQVVVHRNAVPARAAAPAVTPRETTAMPAPFVGARGKVVQLGAYTTLRQADAAWWRLVRAYPYLGTLPRVVTWIGPSPGRPRYYRVRLAAGSRREARALCKNLHRIGRGCMVV